MGGANGSTSGGFHLFYDTLPHSVGNRGARRHEVMMYAGAFELRGNAVQGKSACRILQFANAKWGHIVIRGRCSIEKASIGVVADRR